MKKQNAGSLDTTLLQVLRKRFEAHPHRHQDIGWDEVEARLRAQPEKLNSLSEMERTGGEPDVIGRDASTGAFLFCDCSAETPAGRRSLCYDKKALDERKEHKPANSALELAAAMGVALLSEEDYRRLQQLGPFDTKTSSWLLTPADVRSLGGALFGDYRYGRVFVYHNGASSYYAVRGFRGKLVV